MATVANVSLEAPEPIRKDGSEVPRADHGNAGSQPGSSECDHGGCSGAASRVAAKKGKFAGDRNVTSSGT